MCLLKQSVIRTVRIASLICVEMVVALSAAVFAQQTPPQQTNATGLIGQISNAFSAGQLIHQITLSGNAIWHAGGQDDSGPVTLTATMTGEFQMTLQLSRGQKLETQTGTGTGAACSWTGSDGKAHNIDLGNCLKPAVWFLPAISLQPSMLSSSVVHGFRLFYKYVIINVTDFRKLTILVSHLYSKISFFRIFASSPHIVAQLHA